MAINGKRLLAAIMFTDMVGYTALMQKNEGLAIQKRERHRLVLKKCVEEFNGEILQYYGDGTLIIFNSAIDAVSCAKEIQHQLQQVPKVPLRVGIHSGDVVYNDEGVYGDCVNIASRIESFAVPGSILVSEKVYDEIKNHPEFSTQSIGNYELKNVKRPLEIYAITNGELTIPNLNDLVGKGKKAVKSVAVLPFVNMSTDVENEYFSDGITEELINALAKVDSLQVTSRTSSFAFKGKNDDVRRIGQLLGVTTVLEGSVRKAGDRVRVTAQLINVKDGYHLWSETFDRRLKDIFEVQDEISINIANKLVKKLSAKNMTGTLIKPRSQNLDAYNFYLKGLYYWNKWSPDSVKKAIGFFEEAMELDPGFADPVYGLSSCYVFLAATGQVKPLESFEKAKAYAKKGLLLDPDDEGAHLSMAMVKLLYDWDWVGAGRAFEKSIEINNSNAAAHHYYSLYLLTCYEDNEGSLKEIQTAAKLDPLSLPINLHIGHVYMACGKYGEAIEQFDKTLELDPNFRAAVEAKGWVYINTGEYQKALKWMKQFQKMTNHPLKGMASLGCAYALAGKSEKAQDCLNKLEQRRTEEKTVSLNADFATLHLGLGNHEKALQYIEAALEEKMMGLFLKTNPIWESLNTDGRLDELLEKYGL